MSKKIKNKIRKIWEVFDKRESNGIIGFAILIFLILTFKGFDLWFFTYLILALWNLYYAFELDKKINRKKRKWLKQTMKKNLKEKEWEN